jgi:aminomethyltransferase
MTELLHSPLHDRHVALGAKMADFGGWSMPIEYPGGGVVAEHTAVREKVGIFDVSHLGKARVSGPGAADFVNACLTNDLRRIGPGQAQYTMCCTETGGVVDDLIQYLRSDEDVFLIPNAANTAKVVELLAAAAPEGITVENLHDRYGVIAVQGPRSDEVLRGLGFPVDHDYMSFVETQWEGLPVIVCRTGYTGERGYEIVPPWDVAGSVWDALAAAVAEQGGLPAGLGARDTLRTEMGYPLHGNDLSLDITPVMAGAAWAVGWDKPQFWGREALTAERAAKTSRPRTSTTTSSPRVTDRSSRARAMPWRRVGEKVPDVTSPTTAPVESLTAQCERGMPRPVTTSPRISRDCLAARSAVSASRPQNCGLSQPTAQAAPAITGVMSSERSLPCRG